MAVKYTTLAAKTVAVAGTAEAITVLNIQTPSVVIQALESNTGSIYIGDSSVDSTNGTTLAPSDVFEFSGDERSGRGGADELILTDLFVDSAVNGEGINISYFGRRNGVNP